MIFEKTIKISLYMLLFFIPVISTGQEINLKTNLQSALIGVPSLWAELQIAPKGSLWVGYYTGQYEFLGIIHTRGLSLQYRQYLSNRKKHPGLQGWHLDIGANMQKEWEEWQPGINKTLGLNTVIGYQNTFRRTRIIYDFGLGFSWTVYEDAPLYSNFAYPRLNASIGYKLKK